MASSIKDKELRPGRRKPPVGEIHWALPASDQADSWSQKYKIAVLCMECVYNRS